MTSHYETARANLRNATDELNRAPEGPIPTDVMNAHSHKAQVYALCAIAEALLNLTNQNRTDR